MEIRALKAGELPDGRPVMEGSAVHAAAGEPRRVRGEWELVRSPYFPRWTVGYQFEGDALRSGNQRGVLLTLTGLRQVRDLQALLDAVEREMLAAAELLGAGKLEAQAYAPARPAGRYTIAIPDPGEGAHSSVPERAAAAGGPNPQFTPPPPPAGRRGTHPEEIAALIASNERLIDELVVS